ncbi:hypothetical protein EI94DRAFT_1785913 [Lactarius quietus]|nr:hypothetical protein EI94DRAFT_1785913 [Lactarius quietus]
MCVSFRIGTKHVHQPALTQGEESEDDARVVGITNHSERVKHERDLTRVWSGMRALRTKGLQKDLSYLWGILEKLPGIKESELYLTGVGEWGSVWKIGKATAFLPALRRVRIVADLKYVSPLSYAIIGDLPKRRIVRLPNPTEVDTISVLEAVSAEEELENMSGGLLRFFQGLVR